MDVNRASGSMAKAKALFLKAKAKVCQLNQKGRVPPRPCQGQGQSWPRTIIST